MDIVYTLYVKNMVCQRCILIVRNILTTLDISVSGVNLGRITFLYELDSTRKKQLADSLQKIGLKIIECRVNQLVEEVKQCVRDYLSLSTDSNQLKLSSFISGKLAYEFGYLSDLFSKLEGITVERYFMLHRLEKVKELLDYDQISLSEIAFEVGFSSVHHLSAQFKKLTGITPSQYKQLAVKERKFLDLVGI
ncbi:AraC family transcriptional regulator [Chitinophaga silvatica]|uniref:AraC family transcriptional regulator n=1 Tax=Chitinophaga silvatica TaxID=2282649 RepID=A0A3E1Y7Y3_9BACT|nr:AraC family transcriptional regulator [Chitinophaga silvatica]RFS21322.1 AraC family transcriptional regulator [Chitinophaga silvatica]